MSLHNPSSKDEPRLRFALVGKKATERALVARHLYNHRAWKRMRLDDGIAKYIRYMYYYKPHQRIKWEQRVRFYDASYKLDPEIHVGYLLRRLDTTTWDVVVDDARYINEVQRLKDEAGFIIIRVHAPETKKIRLPMVKDASAGTTKLNEYFGMYDAFPVDYSLSVENRENAYIMIDRIVEKERAKLVDKIKVNDISSESGTLND